VCDGYTRAWEPSLAQAGMACVEGAADDPVKFPKMLSGEKFEIVKDKAGVLVGVATEVVNSGVKFPALTLATVPAPPEFPLVHVPGLPGAVQYQLFSPGVALIWKYDSPARLQASRLTGEPVPVRELLVRAA